MRTNKSKNIKQYFNLLNDIMETTKEPKTDIHFKDEGDMTTVCFMSDNSHIALKSDPNYKQIKERVYGDKVLKIDIVNESVRNMQSWAVSHNLSFTIG